LSAGKKDQNETPLPHPIWSKDEVEDVKATHDEPKDMVERLALYTVRFMRKSFDFLSGYTIGKKLDTLDERSVLKRCIYLETVAGVPGFAAAMVRHCTALGFMQPHRQGINELLQEAENESYHLLTFIKLRNPGPFFRCAVLVTQVGFSASFFCSYLVSPKFSHKLVGYLEEEAVTTYTHILELIDNGKLPMLKGMPAPKIAIDYWKLAEDAKMKEVFQHIRKDEAKHRDVNHDFSSRPSSSIFQRFILMICLGVIYSFPISVYLGIRWCIKSFKRIFTPRPVESGQ